MSWLCVDCGDVFDDNDEFQFDVNSMNARTAEEVFRKVCEDCYEEQIENLKDYWSDYDSMSIPPEIADLIGRW